MFVSMEKYASFWSINKDSWSHLFQIYLLVRHYFISLTFAPPSYMTWTKVVAGLKQLSPCPFVHVSRAGHFGLENTVLLTASEHWISLSQSLATCTTLYRPANFFHPGWYSHYASLVWATMLLTFHRNIFPLQLWNLEFKPYISCSRKNNWKGKEQL